MKKLVRGVRMIPAREPNTGKVRLNKNKSTAQDFLKTLKI